MPVSPSLPLSPSHSERLGGFAVAAAGSFVAVEGFGGPVAEGDGAESVAFAAYHRHSEVQVDVGGVEAGHLPQPDAGVDEQAQDGLVADVLEALAGTRRQQRPQFVGGQDRDWLLLHLGWVDAPHRV